jgi:CheY-like chemotaxis protein
LCQELPFMPEKWAVSSPSAAALPPESFVEEVRAALDHLYDYAFLHNHPLTWRLCRAGCTDGVTRAQRARAVLLDAVEHLRPEAHLRTGGIPGDEMRAYAILTYRCMDGMSMDEIAGKLGLSRRQIYREYAKGIEAVACLVWDALPVEPVTQVMEPTAILAGSTRLSTATEEVTRLTSNLLLEQVDLVTVAQEVANLVAPRMQTTGVALHVQGSKVALPIAADRALLRQALLNLFSYALDQAGRGGNVDVSCLPPGREMALRLATRRGDEHPPSKREGVGVAVAQKLIEAMGGRVQMEQAGSGWCCQLLLPAAQRDTVLVVDDNADLTALFQRYAAGHNLNVVGATSGVQALELAKELRPQLILLDLMLSHMDGWEILQRLRRAEETQVTPIVICSVLNEPDLAYSMGASDYVTKPISQSTLVNVLRRWLGILHPAV